MMEDNQAPGGPDIEFCPHCGDMVNRFVNPERCPHCHQDFGDADGR